MSRFYRHRILASFGIAFILIFWFAAAARDQPTIEALTARVGEIQSMLPRWMCALCLHLPHAKFSDIVFSGEKEQLAQALKDEEVARKSYAGEVQEARGEATRLRAEMEKLKEELAAQVAAATQAKDGFDVTERRLRADIGALRVENEKLKEANTEQQRRADIMAERNARWLELAKKANEKMES